MDFDKIIERIREKINSLNETDHLGEIQKPSEIKSLSNYYQNNKIKSFEYQMKKKNKGFDKQTKKEFTILEEDKTHEMINQEIASLKYHDWDKLLINVQKERLNHYVDTFPIMSSNTKRRLKRKLKIMCETKKLTSKKINYNKEEGLVKEISDFVYNKVTDSFSFEV